MTKKQAKTTTADAETKLAQATEDLVKEIKKLKKLETFEVLHHPFKFMGFAFLKGIMVALGSVFAVTVILSFIIFVLSKIELVPIIGDFVGEITSQVQGYQK